MAENKPIEIPAGSINQNLSVQVRMKGHAYSLNPGERAGFDAETVAKLVSLGKAEFIPAMKPYAVDGKPDPKAGYAAFEAKTRAILAEREAAKAG